MQLLRGIVVSVALLLFVDTAWPYPIPPQTLRMLTRDSELIVVAKVGRITRIKGEEGIDDAKAELQISQVLKGRANSLTIEVYYSPDWICPAPPHYEEGKTMLAFLTSCKEGDGYLTVGLSYGAKNLSTQALEVYLARLRELVEIERQTDKTEGQKQLIEWFVRCAEESATRWEGAYELRLSHLLKQLEEESGEKMREVAGGWFSTAKKSADEGEDQQLEEETVDFTKLLTEEQRRRLAEALYRSSSLSDGGIRLIEVVELWQDETLIPFLWSYLKASKQDDYDITEELMRRIATALNHQEALALSEQFSKLLYQSFIDEQASAQKYRNLVREFITLIECAGPPGLVEIKDELPPTAKASSTSPTSWVGSFSLAGLLIGARLFFSAVAHGIV
jgi:hypothetical protein